MLDTQYLNVMYATQTFNAATCKLCCVPATCKLCRVPATCKPSRINSHKSSSKSWPILHLVISMSIIWSMINTSFYNITYHESSTTTFHFYSITEQQPQRLTDSAIDEWLHSIEIITPSKNHHFTLCRERRHHQVYTSYTNHSKLSAIILRQSTVINTPILDY